MTIVSREVPTRSFLSFILFKRIKSVILALLSCLEAFFFNMQFIYYFKKKKRFQAFSYLFLFLSLKKKKSSDLT